MSEKASFVVMRGSLTRYTLHNVKSPADTPVKVADDRVDARDYAKRMNKTARRYWYTVRQCPKL